MFNECIAKAKNAGRVIVQPRMGFATTCQMLHGLLSVRLATPFTVGTITVDAYTRVNQTDEAREALLAGQKLNGFPITVHDTEDVIRMVNAVHSADFPIQVRHGAAKPQHIVEAACAAGIEANEGGPASYTLPYSRLRLADTTEAWREAVRIAVEANEKTGISHHFESFGGCMMGQLCPPSLLIAISTLECLFFEQQGIESVSLSYAQGTCPEQDIGAIIAARQLAERHLKTQQHHVVVYTFMGQFPQTPEGAEEIIRESARIASTGGAARLIVKTTSEAFGIPTIADNVTALQWAREVADSSDVDISSDILEWVDAIQKEAECIITSVLGLSDDVGTAICAAFADGILDVPYCLHADNKNNARPTLDPDNHAIIWANPGSIPVSKSGQHSSFMEDLSAQNFHKLLAYNRMRFDQQHDIMRNH